MRFLVVINEIENENESNISHESTLPIILKHKIHEEHREIHHHNHSELELPLIYAIKLLQSTIGKSFICISKSER